MAAGTRTIPLKPVLKQCIETPRYLLLLGGEFGNTILHTQNTSAARVTSDDPYAYALHRLPCREASFGHAIIQIQDANTAQWTWHRNQEGAMVVGDTVTVKRNTTGCPCALTLLETYKTLVSER